MSESIESLMQASSEFQELVDNVFQNTTEFEVKVLTKPEGYVSAIVNAGQDIDPNKIGIMFMGRIEHKSMAHERFLVDPCDITATNKNSDSDIKNKIRSCLHARVVLSNVKDASALDVGDIIFAEANPGSNNTLYDLQIMKMTGVKTKNDRVIKSSDFCPADLSTLFEDGVISTAGSSISGVRGVNTSNLVLDCANYLQEQVFRTGITQPSEDFIAKLREEEGTRNRIYDDATGRPITSYDQARGTPTIGVGHAIFENEREKYKKYLISDMPAEEIERLLQSDINRHLTWVNSISVPITQNMFDALASFAYNAGPGAALQDGIIKAINQKDYEKAADILQNTRLSAAGAPSDFLSDRRARESFQFKCGINAENRPS